MHYVTAFTSLFESIAMIVSQHQPVVEKYYGNGKMYNVIKRLIEECDRVLSGLLESWEEDRNVMRKVRYTALCLSSSYEDDDMRIIQVQDTSNPYFPSLVPATSKKAIVNADIDAADPREIDKLLSELAGMVSRWSLFRRFLYDRLRVRSSSLVHFRYVLIINSQDDTSGSASPSGEEDDSAPLHIASAELSPPPTLEERTDMLESSKTRVLFSNVIQTYYLPLETWYLRAIIEKSHRLSTLDTSTQPPQNTTPDDVFYIFKVILSRAISTGSLDAVQATATAASAILERDFAGVIRSKLDDVHTSKANPAGLPKGDKAEKDNRTTFMVDFFSRRLRFL
jgi:conserved oligomeric Golgi complex subunit 4